MNSADIKQLLDDIEHDIMNDQNRGLTLRKHDIMQKLDSIMVLLYTFWNNA